MPANLPPFVRRDISDQLEEHLTPGRFVLLVGASTAGKTRSAYEAVLARVGGWPLIVPSGISGASAALDATRTVRRSAVVRLDDLERFLGSDGLSPTHIQNLLHGGRRQYLVLTTLRAEECTRPTDAVRVVGSGGRTGTVSGRTWWRLGEQVGGGGSAEPRLRAL